MDTKKKLLKYTSTLFHMIVALCYFHVTSSCHNRRTSKVQGTWRWLCQFSMYLLCRDLDGNVYQLWYCMWESENEKLDFVSNVSLFLLCSFFSKLDTQSHHSMFCRNNHRLQMPLGLIAIHSYDKLLFSYINRWKQCYLFNVSSSLIQNGRY